MDEPRHPEADGSPYLKLPWPLVAGALAAVLLLALGAGLLANRYLRQPATATVLPPPTSAPIAAATSVVVATATPNTAVAPTTTATPQRAAGAAQPTPTAATAAMPTSTALSATPPTATGEATARPTVSPALVDEIDQAYERYWQVRAEALFDLDESRLPEVMSGEHLAAAERLIRQLRTENRAIETSVRHSYVLVDVSVDSVQVSDTYVDNSVYVDPLNPAFN